MDNLLFSAKAVMPLLLSILTGYLFAALVKWDCSFYKKLNTIVFRVLLPLNLFYNVYSIEDPFGLNLRMIAFISVSILVAAGIGLLAVRIFSLDSLQGPVIVQASFRSNSTVMGVPLVTALCVTNAAQTGAFGSLVICFASIINNLIAIPVLSQNSGAKGKYKKVLMEILTNALVLGSLIGLICVLARRLLPEGSGFWLEEKLPSLFKMIKSFSGAASPMALFCLGAGLDFKSMKELKGKITLGVALRLIICPALVIGLAILLKDPLGLTAVEVPALIAITASPVAIVSAVMVQEMGGDVQLANHIVVWSTVFSMVTVFLFIFLMRSVGLL